MTQRRFAILAFLFLAGLGLTALAVFPSWRESQLSVEPTQLDFGSVPALTEVRRFLVATNLGTEPIIVSALEADAPFRALTGPFTLGPGESHQILVNFLPREPWSGGGKLRLEGRGFRRGSREIPLVAEAHAAAAIEVEPRSLSFGAVEVNRTCKGTITIRNMGGEELMVESLASIAPFKPELASTVVPPGGSQTLAVYFAPTSVGERQSDLTIRSNDPGKSSVSVPLEGSGVAGPTHPAIEVSPASLNFGKVPLGGRGEASLSIRNTGSDPLSITNLTLPAPFSAPTRGRVIAPGLSLALPVTFSPPREGASFAPLVIYSNDPQVGALTVELAGVGILAAGSPANTGGLAANQDSATSGGIDISGGGVAGATANTQGAGGAIVAGSRTPSGAMPGGGTTPSGATNANEPGAIGSQPGLVEGSRFYLATYGGPIPPASVGEVSFDPNSGVVSLSDVQLPRVDAAAGASFLISPTGGVGQVDRNLGDMQISLPIEVIDQMGNKTSVVLQLTTGTSSTTLASGTEISVTGKPVGPDGFATLVATQVMESGPFQGLPIELKLNLRVK
jgi:hypothetical protein